MTLRLYRAAEVCEMTGLQAYVLRSWEKEFPGIGVQRASDGPRLYRQADVDQVLRIKQLVFGEGLTVSGARRRLEDAGPPKLTEVEAAEVLSTLGSDVRGRVASVRDGLKALQSMLTHKPGEFTLQPPPVRPLKGAKETAKEAGSVRNGKAAAAPKRPQTPVRVAARKSDQRRRRASA
jgi:DNA-binding transcriptional MerR regulator